MKNSADVKVSRGIEVTCEREGDRPDPALAPALVPVVATCGPESTRRSGRNWCSRVKKDSVLFFRAHGEGDWAVRHPTATGCS